MTTGTPWVPARKAAVLTTAVGIAVGAVYVLSPATVVFAPLIAALLWWAARGLDGSERRWVLGVLSAALAIRLLIILSMFAYGLHKNLLFVGIFPDEIYNQQRAFWMRDAWLEIPIFPKYYDWAFETYGWSGYHYVLASLQIVFGVMPYGPHLLSVFLTFAGAIALHRVARPAYGPVAALLGLTLVLWLPSLIVWSVGALKEPMFLCLAMLSVAGAVAMVRGSTWQRRLAAAALTGVVIAAVGSVRDGALNAMVVGIGGGLALWFFTRTFWRAIAFAALFVAASGLAVTRPAVRNAYHDQIRQAALRHVNNAMTAGYGYKLLDARFYDDKVRRTGFVLTVEEERRYVVRAFVSFVVMPLPWSVGSTSALAILPQQVLWYILVLLVPLGLFEGLRRDGLLTCVLASYIAVNASAVALNSGNIGTFIRHRDLVVPFILWFSALGAVSGLARFAARGRAHAHSAAGVVPLAAPS